MTAAHCVDSARLLPQAITVTFGRGDLRIREGVTVGVKEIRIDPDFRDTDFEGEAVHHHDIAILILEQPQPGPFVEIADPQRNTSSQNITTAPDDTRTPSDQGTLAATATVLGWGATAEDDTSNTLLRSATVPLVPDSTCATAYGFAFDPTDMLCAGSPAADTGEYDSGGPLLSSGRLLALTSWGKGSARPGFPGVYTRIPALTF